MASDLQISRLSRHRKFNISRNNKCLTVGESSMLKVVCPACNKEVSYAAYRLNKFCPDCGKFLELKRMDDEGEIPPDMIERWNAYLSERIEVSTGFYFPNAKEWIQKRKEVYRVYREKFSPPSLDDLTAVRQNFGSWLLFSNNLSWTTLQRTATYALENPQKISNLLLHLQNEEIDIASRIRNSLQGNDKISGLGQGIITALLHTFNSDKYGVWNSRTIDTFRIFNQATFPSDDLGDTYKRVNETLIRLTNKLKTDLTTLDGFMWFVSKGEENDSS